MTLRDTEGRRGRADRFAGLYSADPKDDKALHIALDLMRDVTNSAYPPNPKTAMPN